MSWPIENVSVGDTRRSGLAQALHAGEVGIVRITGVALIKRPDALAAVLAARAVVNGYANAALTTVGPYLARHLAEPDVYFDRAGELDEVLGDADPRPEIHDALRHALDFESLAALVEPSGRPYASGVVRLHADGVANPLHNDLLARDTIGSGLRVAAATTQLSAIFCLQECTTGGELVIYRRAWSLLDEAWKVQNGLGYAQGVVAEAETLTFRPETGDLYVIAPHHYHEIRQVRGQTRVTLGTFLITFDGQPRLGWCVA